MTPHDVQALELAPVPVGPTAEPVYAVHVDITPHVASRPRARAVAVGWETKATVYDDPGYAHFRGLLTMLLRAHWRRPPLPLGLYVGQVVLVLPRPVRAPRRMTVGGERWDYPLPWGPGRMLHAGVEDLDNLRKGPLDALVKAGVLPDDRLVCLDGGSGKWWAAAGERPCVEIRLWRLA